MSHVKPIMLDLSFHDIADGRGGLARPFCVPLAWAGALCLAACGVARTEDTVFLKDGTERKGDVVGKNETVVRLRTADGVESIPRSKIDSIVSDGQPPRAVAVEQKVEQKTEPKAPDADVKAKPPNQPKAARRRSVPCHDYDAQVKEIAGRRQYRKRGDEAIAAFEKVLAAYREKGGPAGHAGAEENWEWYFLMSQLLCDGTGDLSLSEDKRTRDANAALGYLGRAGKLYEEQGPEGGEANETKGRICVLQARAYKVLGNGDECRKKLETAIKTHKYGAAEEELKKLDEQK